MKGVEKNEGDRKKTQERMIKEKKQGENEANEVEKQQGSSCTQDNTCKEKRRRKNEGEGKSEEIKKGGKREEARRE